MDDITSLIGHKTQKVPGQWEQFLKDFQADVQAFPVINVVGTNGKGSVGWQIARHLKSKFTKVGWFNSPAFIKQNERVQINNRMINDEDLRSLINKWKLIWEEYQLNFFEKWVWICLCYFTDHKIDIAVIEAGIGGELDPTSCFTNQLGVVLTTVGLDHQDILGDTIEDIVTTKVKIARADKTPLWIAYNNKPYLNIIKQLHSHCILAESYTAGGYSNRVDAINIGLVQSVLKYFKISLNENLIQQRLPGRFSKFNNVIIDGAHNLQAFKALLKSVSKQYPKSSIIIILGCAKHKQGQQLVDYAIKNNYHLYICKWPSKWSWDVQVNNKNVISDWQKCVAQHPDSPVLITGSLYFVSDVWQNLF